MLEDTVDDTADTEGWLDDVRSVLFLLCRGRLLVEADHFSGQHVFLLVGGNGDGFSIGNLGSESLLLLLLSLLKESDHVLLILLERLTDDLLVEDGVGRGNSDLFWESS